MRFRTPRGDSAFEIPDDWWRFAEMDGFSPAPGGFYPYRAKAEDGVEVVALTEIEPPQRDHGIGLFKKYKLLPLLFAFSSPECRLPPVEVHASDSAGPYRLKVHNGFHRYYASVAAGYTKLPTVLVEPLEF